MNHNVGIEAIAIDLPKHYLDLSDLAQARGIEPAKFLQGLGQHQMAVASATEDSVALAIGAAQRMMKDFDIDPDSIGLLVVGTETSVDQSKPISSYVHEHLRLSNRCRSFETKHACYGAMAGVQIAIDWIMAGRANGKKALIIATDIARYGAETAGESTQGAGAVAMLISDQPKLFSFSAAKQGYFSEQVMDFWRPNYSKEAVVDGHYSIDCYLKALRACYDMFAEGQDDPDFFSEQRACLYHAPFGKMAQKAHLALLAHIEGKVFLPKSSEYLAAMEDFARRVSPYLELQSRIGNCYTGSLFMALRALLEDADLPPQSSVSLFSYGSGCTAEFMTGQITEGASAILKQFPYRKLLNARIRLSVAEYEKTLLLTAKADQNGSNLEAGWEVDSERSLGFRGVKDHQRIYNSEN